MKQKFYNFDTRFQIYIEKKALAINLRLIGDILDLNVWT